MSAEPRPAWGIQALTVAPAGASVSQRPFSLTVQDGGAERGASSITLPRPEKPSELVPSFSGSECEGSHRDGAVSKEVHPPTDPAGCPSQGRGPGPSKAALDLSQTSLCTLLDAAPGLLGSSLVGDLHKHWLGGAEASSPL